MTAAERQWRGLRLKRRIVGQTSPLEAFVHDPETRNYFFFEVDRPSGIPALPQMVLEGIEIPHSSCIAAGEPRALREVLPKFRGSVHEG